MENEAKAEAKAGVEAKVKEEAKAEADEAADAVAAEPRPTPLDVYMGTYAPSPVDAVYPKDYTGLPTRRNERPRPR